MVQPTYQFKYKSKRGKIFLQLIETHFPPANKLHKIFNCNTVKVSYSCGQNISQIIKGHNKKVTQIKRHHQLECNCRIKSECPFNGDCRKEDVIYKYAALTIFQPKKVYLSLAKGEFKKQRYYNDTQSFRNENYSNSRTLTTYVWKMKKTENETPTLKREILRTTAPYTYNKAMFFISP